MYHWYRCMSGALGGLAIVLVLAGCGGITKGYVYDKHANAAWTQFIPGYTTESCEKIGQSEVCDPVVHPATFIYHPASWELDISTCDGKQGSSCQQNTITVSEDTYNRYSPGDYVDLSKED